ncbi:MAG: DUF742 domain-containing protein, partial [Actinomycetota bacterium]
MTEPGSAAEPGPPSGLRVRPYTMTRGRTTTDIELTIETMIRATPDLASGAISTAEAKAIVQLCADPQSVAEKSAHLVIPQQVVKVQVGDMVTVDAV